MRSTPVVGSAVSWLVSILILAVAGVVVAVLVREAKPELGPAPTHTSPFVRTMEACAHQGPLDIRVDGLVVPYREIELAAEVAGRVSHQVENCKAGEFVTKGMLLLEIDSRDYEFAKQRLETQLQQARASLAELEVEGVNTDALLELAQEDVLLRRGELARLQRVTTGAVSETELDRARQAELAARNASQAMRNQRRLLDARKSRVESTCRLAEIELSQAELDLARTRVTAPIDGVIVREFVEQDSFVQKGATLVTVEDTSAVEVRCNLKMDQIAWLWRRARPVPDAEAADTAAPITDAPITDAPAFDAGSASYQVPRTPVTVVYQLAGRSYAWVGVLSRYEGVGLDDKTRTVPCRVLVRGPRQARRLGGDTAADGMRPPALMRGMYVSVEIHVQPDVQLVRVPEAAVRPGKTIWVVRDGRLRILRQVKLVELSSGVGVFPAAERYWLVERDGDGVAPGDHVVVTPLAYGTDGLEVRDQPL